MKSYALFSHACEELFPFAQQGVKIIHEDYTFRIITETKLAQYIDNDKQYEPGTARKIAEIATGRAMARETAFLLEKSGWEHCFMWSKEG